VGSGEQGRGYGGGIVTEPIHIYFAGRDKITFSIQLPKAMSDYRAFHDNKVPKTIEEFEKEIIKPYGIYLPRLPEGHRYVYNPNDGELSVERPR
jgi:hypothetical protein